MNKIGVKRDLLKKFNKFVYEENYKNELNNEVPLQNKKITNKIY